MIRFRNNLNMAQVNRKMRAAVGVYADTAAKKMEGQAKRGAPWTDRTSNARNSIQGDFGWRGNQAIITLSGGMEYSVYLELAMGKKYAILYPTVLKNAPDILRGYQRLVK
jgi:hypothetical protein